MNRIRGFQLSRLTCTNVRRSLAAQRGVRLTHSLFSKTTSKFLTLAIYIPD